MCYFKDKRCVGRTHHGVFWEHTCFYSARPYVFTYTYIQYCVSVWGSTYPTNLNRLIVLQKKVVRIVARKPHDAHTDPIFKDLEILKFNCVYRFHVSKMLFQLKNNVLLSAFSSIFLFNYQMHGYFTRTFKQFHIPKGMVINYRGRRATISAKETSKKT